MSSTEFDPGKVLSDVIFARGSTNVSVVEETKPGETAKLRDALERIAKWPHTCATDAGCRTCIALAALAAPAKGMEHFASGLDSAPAATEKSVDEWLDEQLHTGALSSTFSRQDFQRCWAAALEAGRSTAAATTQETILARVHRVFPNGEVRRDP